MGYCSEYPLYEMSYPEVTAVLRIVRGYLLTEAMMCNAEGIDRVHGHCSTALSAFAVPGESTALSTTCGVLRVPGREATLSRRDTWRAPRRVRRVRGRRRGARPRALRVQGIFVSARLCDFARVRLFFAVSSA